MPFARTRSRLTYNVHALDLMEMLKFFKANNTICVAVLRSECLLALEVRPISWSPPADIQDFAVFYVSTPTGKEIARKGACGPVCDTAVWPDVLPQRLLQLELAGSYTSMKEIVLRACDATSATVRIMTSQCEYLHWPR